MPGTVSNAAAVATHVSYAQVAGALALVVIAIAVSRWRRADLEQARAGDHICYYSDLRKMRAHYPGWDLTQSLEETIRQIVESWRQRQNR